MIIKDSKYVKTCSVNPLYLIFRNVNGYFEEINKSKYLTLFPPNGSKEKIKKKNMKNSGVLTKSITKNSDYYEKNR